MRNFIEITDENGKRDLINVNHIIGIGEASNYTVIIVSANNSNRKLFSTDLTYDEVVELIKKATSQE